MKHFSPGLFSFLLVLLLSTGFVLAQASCGDGVCDSSEDSQACPQDCAKPAPAPPKISSTVLLGLVLVLVLAVGGFVAVNSGMKPPRGS